MDQNATWVNIRIMPSCKIHAESLLKSIWLDNLEMGHATKTVIVKEEKKFENLNLKPYTVI